MRDARNVLRGHRRGEGRGAKGGKGPEGAFGFLMRFCTKCGFRPVNVKSPFEDDICEIDDEASNGTSSLSTTFTVAMACASAESGLISMAASTWIKSAMMESRES